MLDALKKAAGFKAAEPSAEMESLKAEFAGYKETAEALAAQMEEQLAAAQSAAVGMEQRLVELQSKLDAFEAQAKAEADAREQAAAKLLAQKMEARKASLSAAVGDIQAGAMFAALQSLEDEKFDSVVSALKAGLEAESDSPAFKEQGVDAKSAVPPAQDSRLLKQIQEKYQGQ